MEGTDSEALKQATERLSQAAMKIGEAMYKSQQANEAAEAAAAAGAAAGQHGPQGSGAKPDEKVVDAEFEEVDEKKKKSA
jgi:molecular chaperone DnaK